MPSYCFLHQLKFVSLNLVALATNMISQPFPWLVLNRSYKTCLALQCVSVVVCKTIFFTKVSLLWKTNEIPQKCLSTKLLKLLLLSLFLLIIYSLL